MGGKQKIVLHRMVLPDHICPYGVRAKELLEESGVDFEDRILGSREKVEAFKQEQGVATTPLILVDGEAIGGCDELEDYLARQSAD